MYKRKNLNEVYKYFTEEVINRLSKPMQKFLMNTSVLNVLTPSNCDYIMERKDSKQVLENLMERNVFLMKIEGEEEAYRYHHLFRDFLKKRLGDENINILEKVAQYHLNNDDDQKAIEYYIIAKLYKKAILVIEKIGIKMIKDGKWQTVNRWIKSIPKEFTLNSPYFMLLNGIIYSYEIMLKEALINFDKALKLFLLDENKNKENILNTRFQKAIVLRKIGSIEESLKLLNEILLNVKSMPILEWYDVVLEKVSTLLWNGYLNEGIKSLKRGIKIAQTEENDELIAYFMEHLGAAYYATGDYYKAVKIYKESNKRYLKVYTSLSEIEKERYSQRTTIARIYRDWGELHKALKIIKEEISIKERLGLIEGLPRAYHQLGLICNDFGNREKSQKYFNKADELYKELNIKDFHYTWHMALYGRVLMENGKVEKGKELIKKSIKLAKSSSEFSLAVCEFVGCYFYLYDGKINEATKSLEHTLVIGKKVGAKYLSCQCCWILSNIYSNMGNKEKAKEYAIYCLSLSRKENYLQVFLSYKTTSFQTIKFGIEMGIEEEFIEKIVVRLGDKAEQILFDLMKSSKLEVRNRAKKLLIKIKGEDFILQNKIPSKELDEKSEENKLIYVYCFGNFKVLFKKDSKSIQWKTTKAQELFAYLIKYSNKAVSKDKILEDIWPDMNPEQTSVWLHTYIYQIRNVLKKVGIKKGLVYENKGYSLISKGIIDDVYKFKKLIKNSKKCERMQDKIEYLKQAISLYKGDYLEGFYNKWIVEEKYYLEEIYISSLEHLAKIYIENKEYKKAVKYLEKMLKKDPLLEKAHEMLIMIYDKTGNRIAGINQYENYCEVLKNELGIEPKIEIKNLYEKFIINK